MGGNVEELYLGMIMCFCLFVYYIKSLNENRNKGIQQITNMTEYMGGFSLPERSTVATAVMMPGTTDQTQ